MANEQKGGYDGVVDADRIRLAKLMKRREQGAATVGRKTNQDFLSFREAFLEHLTMLRELFMSVYTDKSMGIDELYTITNGIFSSMQYKMDAVLYLNAIYSSEYYVIEHCLRVGLLANILSNWLGYDAEAIKEATVAGFLHDIGMLQIPPEIIEKQDSLTSEEFDILKEHPIRGIHMLINKGVDREILEAIRSHHERYDGSGYPNGFVGGSAGTLSSLISIVDVYDSMTSNRPYRVATCPFDVIDYFEKQMIDKFDPGLLYTFLENVPYMYNGSLVKLSDDSEAKVIFINKNHKTSPIVQIRKTGEVIDLYSNRDLKIVHLL